MTLMPMAGYVTNDVDVDLVATNDTTEGEFPALPDSKETLNEYEYEPSDELIGMRDQTTKTYVLEDGKFAQLTHDAPVHYIADSGEWTDINTNVVATPHGWEVTENTFSSYFAPEIGNGVSVQVNEFVNPIYMGIQPMLVTFDESATYPSQYMAEESNDEIAVGGNMIRYPLAEGFAIDYTVESQQLKQNLIVSERPVLDESQAWFGFTEKMVLPEGYALFVGEEMVGEDIVVTQESIDIRNIASGELLAEMPVPIVLEFDSNSEEPPYVATYIVSVMDGEIIISTVVESEWILSEDRVFPLAIDPTIRVARTPGGYCYKYYNYCYVNSNYGRVENSRTNTKNYMTYTRHTFTSANGMPNGATVDSISHHQYVNYRTGTRASNSIAATVLEWCGSAYSYRSWSMPSAMSGGCNGVLSPSRYSFSSTQYNSWSARILVNSLWNSPAFDTITPGTGWKVASVCNTASTCSSSGAASKILAAQTGTTSVGIGYKVPGSIGFMRLQSYNSGSYNSYISIVYSGGTDADAPTSGFIPYTGVTSYIEGSRTFFTSLTDLSGIDTTSANKPTLNYALNNGSFTSLSATSIGTCSSTTQTCRFKAVIPSVSAGDYVEYYWKYQDLSPNGANVGYDPALSGAQSTPTPYFFAVEDDSNAGYDKKLTVLTTDVYAGGSRTPPSSGYFDRQFTHFNVSNEFYFEFDVSNCGSGSSGCFYSSNYYRYGNWVMQHATGAGTGYNGMASSNQRQHLERLHYSDGGYLTISATNGPGMNLLYHYNTAEKEFAMVGIGSAPSIDAPLQGGKSARTGYTGTYYSNWIVDFGTSGNTVDHGGMMGEFGFGNVTTSKTDANRLCIGSSGFTYFWRSPYSSRNACSASYSYTTAYGGGPTSSVWSGWALGTSYYGRSSSTTTVTYDSTYVKPMPDNFAPDIVHLPLGDSYSKTRTVSAIISDAGEPASGLNVSTTPGVGPTMYFRVTPDGGTTGAWNASLMIPAGGQTQAQCILAECTWTADIEDLELNDEIEYYITAQDISPAATGVNTATTSNANFGVGDPTTMFVVEWREMMYTTVAYTCTYQAIFYDVTNEIEFRYDNACRVWRDAATVGFMDQTKAKGQTIRHSTSTQNLNGANPHTNNYRITTSATGDGSWEAFDRGTIPMVNADVSKIIGTSNGYPRGYDCSSTRFTSYGTGCADNIPMPNGFNFTYFGTDYNFTDTNDRIHISRHGNMHFISTGSPSTVRTMSTSWGANMPTLPGPNPSTSFAKAGMIAPYWSYYGSYYCYQSQTQDCGVYYRTMPFEGKGTDVSADITTDTTWDLTDSPIRINPANDYLAISADLTIEPGTVIQVAPGKGISFDGACDQMSVLGNSTHHVRFEGQNGAEWKGMAFTGACSTGTDDRHVFSYVDFKNTTDAAIAAGSRHGSSPVSNSNVGNFTMDHVTYENVGTAFSHGSGRGTVVSMNEFQVTGADNSCFDFAQDTIATMTEGTITNCNTNGGGTAGSIVNIAGSTAGSLFLENVTITNSYVNLISVDFASVTLSNVTSTATTLQSGSALNLEGGNGAEVYIYNLDADDYTSAGIDATGVINMTDVDLGDASFELYPAGSSSSSVVSASGDNAMFNNVEAGDMTMRNIQPGLFTDVSVGDLKITGDPAVATDQVNIVNLNAEEVVMEDGCGWNARFDSMTADLFASVGCSASRSQIVIADSTIGHTSTTQSVFYALNSDITIGETAVTSTATLGTNNIYLAQVDTNSNIRLVEVTQDGDACADSSGATGDCDVDVASSSSEIWYGGLATVRTYRNALVSGVPTTIYKGGHTVSAAVFDSSELFIVGSHLTSSATATLGTASVWVITGNEDDGDTFDDHNIRAFGGAGQNETLTTSSWYPATGFTIGSTIELLLQPAPVDLDAANMDCAWMDAYRNPDTNAPFATNGTTPAGKDIYEFIGTSLTVSSDLTLDGCAINLVGSSLKVKSTATSTPIITLVGGGMLIASISDDDGSRGAISAISPAYGLNLNIVKGTLDLDGGSLSNVAQDATTGAALLIGPDATLLMSNNAIVYGSSATADDMATVKVNGGSVSIADSSIINNGKTGTALWMQNTVGSVSNVIVKNAAVGIQSYNGAPQVNGFTATDNTVGLDVYGGMSLPTVYRSTLLSGQSAGWTTHEIDLSGFLSEDFLQVGWNSIYGGGNAHPRYNYRTTKYYMMTDRYNIQLTDSDGNAWNITDGNHLGYYPYSAADPRSGDGTHATYAVGATGGIPSWDCNVRGYFYGPNYNSISTGFYPYINQYFTGSYGSYPGYYRAPTEQFGFDWENIDDVTPSSGYGARYPNMDMGYYYTSYHAQYNSKFYPPEGFQGSYNVCTASASTYYMSSGQGARMTMPTIDLTASNLSKVTLFMDVLHNRADNYQDRLEFVARGGSNPAALGDYVRESGTPNFNSGVINGADTGVSVGGGFAAANFDGITVNNPVDSGLEISGQVASFANDITVNGGTYGVLIGNLASGKMGLTNLSIDGATTAGVYYTKDLGGDLSGTVINTGAAFKYGPNTDDDITFNDMSISNNSIGIDSAGKGNIVLTDVTLNNTKDARITGQGNVDVIDGSVNASTVEVTGTGTFTRLRAVDITVTADGNPVGDSTVSLVSPTGVTSGSSVTNTTGVASGLTFPITKVNSNGLTTPSIVGYKAVTVAKVAYSYTSSTNNIADFRYASQQVLLANAEDNVATLPLTTRIHERVCFSSTSTSFTTVATCAGYFSASTSRQLSDGNGGTVTESGYLAGLAYSNRQNEVLMLDTPYIYWKGNGGVFNMTGGTILATGAYNQFDSQRWYARYPYGTQMVLDDASVYGVTPNADDGGMYGVHIGYYQFPITHFQANNTTFSNLASIELENGYTYGTSTYYWEMKEVSITNSTLSHYRTDKKSLIGAVDQTEQCINVAGGEDTLIHNNVFENCLAGVVLSRSTYHTRHGSKIGAWNVTISENTFNNGGHQADIWMVGNGNSKNVQILDNVFNNEGSLSATADNAAISVFQSTGNSGHQHKDLLIKDNTINAAQEGIFLDDALNYRVTNNTINGVGDSSFEGINVRAGTGAIDNNTLVDADGGIVVEESSQPATQGTNLCFISGARYGYRYSASCTFTVQAGQPVDVNIAVDTWGYEASLEITKPGGAKDTWGRGTSSPFPSYSGTTTYNPLVTYNTTGQYTLTARDSYGDGGIQVNVIEAAIAAPYTGPVVADNTITSSDPFRIAPNAVGLVFDECTDVVIQSARNTISVSDNALSMSNCDVIDDSSSFVGDGSSSTVGINADDANNDVLTLSGTTIDGFSTGVHKTSGSLTLAGGADITGTDYGVYVDDVSVTAIDAAVNAGAAGTGLHVVDSDDVWVYPMNASGLVGMYVENTPFRWDGGTSTAVTSLQVVESEGSVENMTWPSTTTQINAGSNSYVTSIGNTIVANKLTVAPSATIDEANLFSLNSTHLDDTPKKPVAMLIQSTDGSRASYVSTSFQPESMSVDGSNADWVGGNALDPSGYAMPGKMSGNDTNDMLVTYIEGDYLYIGLTGEDLAASDVLVYLNVGGAGTTTGYNLGGAHTLPFLADYVLWADDASNYALYSHGFLGWGQTTSSSGATVQVASTSNLTEIAIPFSQIGGTPSEIDIVTIVQGESTADVSTIHPTQNINESNTLQSFTDYMTVELTKDDLVTGIIDDEVLVYRSYKGSNSASAAKNYDLMIRTKAACSHDWAVVENISLSTNVAFDDDYVMVTGDTTNVQNTIDIKRACPEIQPALDNITIDEDSGVYTFSLLNMAEDEQDAESTLAWTSAERNLVAFDADADGVDAKDAIVSWNQNVQQFTITPLENQFGSMVFDFEVTDSNGLKDTKFINLVINNVNDAPIICNSERSSTDCMPIFSVDDIYTNINSEGFNNITESLGSVANVATSYIEDQANEQVNRQTYDWDASVDSSCVAFTVNVSSTNSLIIYENQSNEKGGTCTITMELSDDGPVNNTAVPFTVDYSVAPVNDAPEISLQDANGQNLIVSDAGERAEGQGEFITMTEDDTNADNLTWDLLPLMSDIDHDVPSELTWEVQETSQCTYKNYFTTDIVGTDLVFTLIPDATTNAKEFEKDFMNDNGVHQVRPNDQTFCAITLHLNDTIAAPVHTPNYDSSIMPIANYSQGTDSTVLYVTIENVAEKVADYSLNTVSGVDFNGITNIMTGTEVPVSVNIDAGGDEGPYTYDHMLAVTFFTDGHTDDQYTRTSYYNVPDYGQSLTVHEDVYLTKDTTRVEVSMDVLTCLNNPCDLTVPSTERFQTDSPESHRANNGGTQGAEWSKPGQYGLNGTQSSERRPMLQDNYWCNNRLTTLSLDAAEASADWGKCNEFDAGQGSFGATNQTLPSVVRTIGASAVPSFAPSIVAVSLTGLFVGALAFSSRRADDEEEMLENTSIEDDDMAVSPVIATILMVAITVVLSGVIYVWASSLADTDVKGVPRVSFTIDDVNSFDADEGHWLITVQSSETDLATQAVEVRVFYVDASGEAQVVTINLANPNDVYGFNPANSDSMVTFVDQVNSEGDDRVSTFNTGDSVFVRTHDSAGTPLEDVTITINYAPNVGQGAQLRTWQGLSFDRSAN